MVIASPHILVVASYPGLFTHNAMKSLVNSLCAVTYLGIGWMYGGVTLLENENVQSSNVLPITTIQAVGIIVLPMFLRF